MKRKLYLEGLKQLALPAAVSLICGLVLSVATTANTRTFDYGDGTPIDIGSVLWQCCALAYVLPFVFVFCLFRFQYNKKYADLYYSSGVNNSAAFFSLSLASLTLSSVILTLCFVLTIALCPLPFLVDTPLYMYLALMTVNITLTAAALMGVSVAGKLFSGIGFAMIIAFAPSIINKAVVGLVIPFGTNRFANEAILYEKNVLTCLLDVKLFLRTTFVNELIAPAAIVFSLLLAAVFGFVGYMAFTRRTAQTVDVDFIHPILRHISAALLAIPFILVFINDVYTNIIYNFSTLSLTLIIVFLVIFITYYTVCTGKISKIAGALIPFVGAVCISAVLCIAARFTPYYGESTSLTLPERDSIRTEQFSEAYIVCDDEVTDLLYEEFEKLSDKEKTMAFEYQYNDNTVALYSKSFWGGKQILLTLTHETFPRTLTALGK